MLNHFFFSSSRKSIKMESRSSLFWDDERQKISGQATTNDKVNLERLSKFKSARNHQATLDLALLRVSTFNSLTFISLSVYSIRESQKKQRRKDNGCQKGEQDTIEPFN